MKKIKVLFALFVVLGLASCTGSTEEVAGEAVVDSTAVDVDTVVQAAPDSSAAEMAAQ